MKNFIAVLFLTLNSISWGQYEIMSIDVNNTTYCESEPKEFIIKVIPNGNTNSLKMVGFNESLNQYLKCYSTIGTLVNDTIEFSVNIDYSYIILPTVNGQATDEFTFKFQEEQGAGNWVQIPMLDTLINNLTVYGTVSPNFDLSTAPLCTNGLPFDLNNYVDLPGGEFDWGSEINNIFDPKEYFLESGSLLYINYKYTNNAGCVGNNYLSSININTAPVITSSSNDATCGSANGSATINVALAVGLTDCNVYWSTGYSQNNVSSSSSVSNISSGTYYANVTDPNGCKAVGTVNVTDAGLGITAQSAPQTCTGMNDGTIDVLIPGGVNVTETFWSNGTTTEDMVGGAGEYSVHIHTDNNCNFFGTYTIPDSSIHFSFGNTSFVSCGGTALGNINVTATVGIGVPVIEWTDNTGTTVGTDEVLMGVVPGVYTCTITDGNMCSKSWNATLGMTNNIAVTIDAVTKSTCGNNNGEIQVTVNLYGVTIDTWEWLDENGDVVSTTEDLLGVPAGVYTLKTNSVEVPACVDYTTVKVLNERPYQPQICLLTVDTSNTYNMIIWEKDGTPVVDGWNLYRETSVYGDFELVATIPYEDDAIFIDNAASPMSRSWRYYITSFNSCVESYGSFIHKTIHIVTANDNAGTGMDVFWDDYEGINYSSLNLLKYTNATGWVTIPVTGNSYNDASQAVDPSLNYMLEFVLASPCNPGKAIDHNSSRSNKSSSTFHAGGETGLTIIENEDGKIMMYPNPTRTDLTIYIENVDKFKSFKIVDINGKLIHQQTVTTDYNFVSTTHFAKGIYFVQIYSQNNVIIEKIIKQ